MIYTYKILYPINPGDNTQETLGHLNLLLPIRQHHELEHANGSHMSVDVLVDLGTALE